MSETPFLTVEDLHVAYQGRSGFVPALRGVSFTVGRERLGIVGESGSGKSTIGRAILGLLPHSAKVTARKLRLPDIDLLSASERALRSIRGRRISMVLQDPKYSLNPVMTVGRQICRELPRAQPRLGARGETQDARDARSRAHRRPGARLSSLSP
jgi:peptide/nickel transport system ATP-binding protein